MTSTPAPAIYGGDEISALVLDPGSSWTRAGFAGEDTPKAVIPSYYGHVGENKDKILLGDDALYSPKPNVEISNPMKDGYVEDWDAAVKIWDYAISNRLRSDPRDHPLLMTEPGWNPLSDREKAIELAFESLQVPAFFLAKDAVCTTFASGKATALVVDIGSSVAKVAPVFDGLILKKGIQHSSIAGDYVSKHIAEFFESKNVSIVPHYRVKKKSSSESNQDSNAVLKTYEGITPSFDALQRERVFLEFKECASQISETPLDPLSPIQAGARVFELPDGESIVVGAERFTTTECLFQPQAFPLKNSPNLPNTLGISQLLQKSILSCDVDARANLVNNIIVTGGSTLLSGFTERLSNDLITQFPGMKIRIHAPGNTIERRYSAWIGGSILASLGTFHQMWISKKEYQELGAGIIEKRCK